MTPDPPGPVGPLLDVPPVAVELGDRFRAAGHELYLVGGAVRDLLLQRASRTNELDFATSAKPEQTLHILQDWAERRYLTGIKFGTVGARRGDVLVEITT